MNPDINLWAVLVCAIASMATGYIWYGPLFLKPWMKEMGWDLNDQTKMDLMQKQASKSYLQQFIGAVIMAYVFAYILMAFNSALGDGIATGLQLALWVWFGFIATVKYSETLWGGDSKKLFFIDSLYYLLNLAVFAMVLTLWR